MRSWTFVTAGLAFASGPVAAQVVAAPTVVALSGTPAPAGGNYSSVNTPVRNGSGQVAFKANLTGGSSTQGIFAGAPGSIQPLARQDSPPRLAACDPAAFRFAPNWEKLP